MGPARGNIGTTARTLKCCYEIRNYVRDAGEAGLKRDPDSIAKSPKPITARE